MTKPTIMYISDVSHDKAGGAQESIRILVEGLSSHYRVVPVSPESRKINDLHHIVKGYSTFNLRKIGKGGFLRISWILWRVIKRYKPEILHLQMSSVMIICRFLLLIGFFPRRTRIVLTDRGVYGKASSTTTWAINGLIPRASAIILTTENNKRNYAERYSSFSKFSDKFHVIPNTAGSEFEQFDLNERDTVRNELNIPLNSTVLGFCARYSSEKGWDLAQEIIELFQKNVNVEVIVVLGSDRGGKEKHIQIKRYLESLRSLLGDRLHGFVDISGKEVSRLYYAMDFFILTSRRESFGRTAIEAMTRKTIVLGTNVDGIPEVLGDNRFIYNNAEDAYQTINSLIGDSMKTREYEEFFFERYHSRFGVKYNIACHDQLYREILKSR